MNSVLYALTWLKIRSEIKVIRYSLDHYPRNRRTSSRVAKSMSLFVAAFFIQWWAAGLYGAWGLFGEPHEVVTHASVIFSNIGGALNLCVFIMNSRRRFSSLRDNGRKLRKTLTPESRTRNNGNESDVNTSTEKCTVSTIL